MPTYEYRCPDGHDFERFFRKISDAPAEVGCPECGKIAERRMSAGAGLLFKGSGFYLTDYGKNAHRGTGDVHGGAAESAPVESKGGEGKGGEGKGGEGKGGEGKSGEGKSGEGKGGEAKSGEGKGGEKKGDASSPKGESKSESKAEKKTESKPSSATPGPAKSTKSDS
jgi:putative FmdB family regulatory protein